MTQTQSPKQPAFKKSAWTTTQRLALHLGTTFSVLGGLLLAIGFAHNWKSGLPGFIYPLGIALMAFGFSLLVINPRHPNITVTGVALVAGSLVGFLQMLPSLNSAPRLTGAVFFFAVIGVVMTGLGHVLPPLDGSADANATGSATRDLEIERDRYRDALDQIRSMPLGADQLHKAYEMRSIADKARAKMD